MTKQQNISNAKTQAAEQTKNTRTTSLISMTKYDKERLTSIAKTHGLSLSAFFRLAADEYIAAHKW